MPNIWSDILIFGSLAAIATLVGMSLVLFRESWCRQNSGSLISFSAGVLLAVGFLHILPEALELTGSAMFCLVAFVSFYFLEHHLVIHAEHEQLQHSNVAVPNSHTDLCANPNPLGIVAFLGMSLHSLIDGLIIGTGFEVGHETGLLSAIAIMAHKIPAGISIFSILLHYGFTRKRAQLFTCTVALGTPLGAILAAALFRNLPKQGLGILLALAAGSFVYIAASDLIPESHRAKGLKGSLSLCGGILAAILAGMIAHH
jgi:zinc and cadmium transporter